MEIFKTENLSFTYPKRMYKALDDISITIKSGEFVTVCGKSGCGKSTLLRLLKPSLSPVGEKSGGIYFCGKDVMGLSRREEASKIGFVMQSPENQIVTDKVWHELAFAAENLGVQSSEIRKRVAEMASFFGIQNWFYKNVSELSGGQKQILNIASVMVMQPSVLVLDEPASRLDPIAAGELMSALEKLNREIGTTVILSEHCLEYAFPISDRVIVMENGKIIADAAPCEVGEALKNCVSEMLAALPAPMRICAATEDLKQLPVTVREGRAWLEEFAKKNVLLPIEKERTAREKSGKSAIMLENLWFRYEKNNPDTVRGLSLNISEGEIFAVTGGNGTGKTTLLSLISGINHPYRGKLLINGKKLSDTEELYKGVIGLLPQDPQSVFVKKTVRLDLENMIAGEKLTKSEKEKRIADAVSLCEIEELTECHPYDLSGGEQQRAALAKVLLKNPAILLLDEPTKGMDAAFKAKLGEILKKKSAEGTTIVMVSHDIEFCAEYAERCALMFDGNITAEGTPEELFSGNFFYTTSVCRMARSVLPKAVLAEDVISACGGTLPELNKKTLTDTKMENDRKADKKAEKTDKKRLKPQKIAAGCLFVLLFMLTELSFVTDRDILHLTQIPGMNLITIQIAAIVEVFAAMLCLLPRTKNMASLKQNRTKASKGQIAAGIFTAAAIPLTIFAGVRFFDERKYYLISILIIVEAMLPFFALFERRRSGAREIALLSAMCAIAVGGRTAFFMLPQFKPVAAIVIVSGTCMGGEFGFLVGAVSAFVSNFFFGQGPWTPWQMFAFGIIGFLAGVLCRMGVLKKSRIPLSIFGFLASFVIYGFVMNFSSLITAQTEITVKTVLSYCIMGAPYDLIHACSTAFFLFFASEPLADKLERIKIKYGMYGN